MKINWNTLDSLYILCALIRKSIHTAETTCIYRLFCTRQTYFLVWSKALLQNFSFTHEAVWINTITGWSELFWAGNCNTRELKLCTQSIKYGNTQLKTISLNDAERQTCQFGLSIEMDNTTAQRLYTMCMCTEHYSRNNTELSTCLVSWQDLRQHSETVGTHRLF